MRNYKNLIHARNLQSQNIRTQKNLNLCPEMWGRNQSEHLALWCCPATSARKKIFEIFLDLKLLIFLQWWQWLARIRVTDWVSPPTDKIVHNYHQVHPNRSNSPPTKTNIQASFRIIKFVEIDQILCLLTNIHASFIRNSNIREPRSDKMHAGASWAGCKNDKRRYFKGISLLRDKLLCSWLFCTFFVNLL